MKAVTSSPDELKAVISMVSTVVEEAIFTCTADGITFRGMDPSHIALIDISLPAEMFEEYECLEDSKFGIRVDEFSALIKRAEKKDGLSIGVEKNQLIVKIGGKKRYTIKLLESLGMETHIPKIPYTTKFEIAMTNLDRLLGDVAVIAEYIIIRATSTGISFSGKGESGRVDLEAEVDGYNTTADAISTYSLEHLIPAVKAIGTSSGSAIIEFSGNKPIRLEFRLGGVGRIHFYLAPRVE